MKEPNRTRAFSLIMTILFSLVLTVVPATAETTVTSAAEVDYPPFSIVEPDGGVTGFSVELLRAALAAMDREVTFRTGPWAEVRGWLEAGEIQALPLVGRTPEREEIFDFTIPYMTLYGAIVVRDDTTDVRSLEDLRGRSVAVMEGDNAEEFLRREDRGVEIVTTVTFEEALRRLSQGRHDAVVMQRIVALRLIEETGLTDLQVVERPLAGFQQEFCFAVTEGDSETLALLNEGLALVMADGTYRHLHSKWFATLELPADRRIVVGGDHNFPPFEFLDANGRPAGFNVDITRAIARELGLDVEIRLGPWSEMREALKQGEIDALQGLFYSTGLDLVFDFTQAHTIAHYVGVVRDGERSPPATAEELAGMQVVVQEGDIMHDYAIEHGLDQLTIVETQEAALRQLAQGLHDAALVARVTAAYWIEEAALDNLEVGSRPLLSAEYAYAVADDQQALLSHLSDGLQLLDQSGEYRRIREKWMGVYDATQVSLGTVLRYVGFTTAPLGLIVLVVLLWVRVLKNQVAKRTEELREREEFLRVMIACSPVALYSVGPDGTVVAWNQSAERVFGWTADEVMGKPLPIVPDDRVEEFETLRKRVLAGESVVGEEVERLRKDGDRFVGSLSVAAIRDAQETIIGIMGSMEDITERRNAEQRIAHLNGMLRSIRDVTELIVRTTDRDELLGRTCRLLVQGHSFSGILIVLVDADGQPETWAHAGLEKSEAAIESSLTSGTPVRCSGEGCPIMEHLAGTERMCAQLAHAGTHRGCLCAVIEPDHVLDPEEEQLFGELADDIAYALHAMEAESARIEAEKRLLVAQKLEAIGRLAGGVAHDFNNMLSVILGHVDLAVREAPEGSSIAESLSQIRSAGERSSALTRQLLAFARKQTVSPQVVDLNDLVERMLTMLRRLIGDDIVLEWLPAEELWPVKIDPSQIDQIMANLCVNARDAVSGVGKVTVETRNVRIDGEYGEARSEEESGEFVMLAVTDDGKGMDRETLANVFEPFFTTKKTGEGTGLGLATVYGITQQNKGFIQAFSEVGEGATFRVYLPRCGDEATEATSEVPEEATDEQTGDETVLLVEDEPAVRDMAVMMLERLGYEVLVADSPEEAVRLAQTHEGGVGLLLTDVIMPGMDGRELALCVTALHPEMKTLFMSGYTTNVIMHRGVLEQDAHFIQKPFSMTDLASAVSEALHGNG